MSILIKGMEMPSNGAERCIVIRSDRTVRTFVGAEIPASAEQLPPHGRLIDADKLKKQIEDENRFSAVYAKATFRYLDNAPTIIEAEKT